MNSNQKINVNNPIVDLDGDEITRIIWQLIKDKLISPFLNLSINTTISQFKIEI